ncbi:MAG: type IV pilus biogenesis/stability protein PilW [Burkholderiales bacterium]|jgi:type IV pilus assembly protein PilF|nr:type IV pilus biogenesis/stability protein PilW [Burkholderiales bacterium]
MSARSRRVLVAMLLAALAAGCKTTTTTVAGVEVPVAAKSEADPRKRAEIRTDLASSYYRDGRLGVALEEAQRAVQSDSRYAPAHGLLGLIYMEIGDRSEAEASFARALRLEPENSGILNNYGWFLCQSGRERESVEYFQRAAANRLYATPALAMRNAGVCLLKINDVEGGERALRRALELDASDPVTKFELARMYLRRNQPERANFYYGLLDPVSRASAPGLWLGLRIARANGDIRRERELAGQLRERFPDSAEAAALRRGAFDE